jgi:hypothetical protein
MPRIILSFMMILGSFTGILRSETTAVDKEFQGIWIPVNRSSCSTPMRIEVSNKTVVLRNGNHSSSYKNIELCYSCAGGAGYSGIEVQLYPEIDVAPSPFIIRFNADEMEGIMDIEVQDPEVGKVFPFDNLKFKKCKQ